MKYLLNMLLSLANMQNSQLRSIRREPMFHSDDDVPEDLMKNHNEFLSNLRSRLTKLQVNLSYLCECCY